MKPEMTRTVMRMSTIGLLFALSCSLQKAPYEVTYEDPASIDQPFARVGEKVISVADFECVRNMQNNYPQDMNYYFPSGLKTATMFAADLEALYQHINPDVKTRRVIENRADWQLKKTYFAYDVFKTQLAKTFGFTEKEIEDYYEVHRGLFTEPLSASAPASSGGQLGGDSYLFLGKTKRQVIDCLLSAKYPLSADFADTLTAHYPQIRDSLTHNVDTVKLHELWLEDIKKNGILHFTNFFYQEKFGKPLVDVMIQAFGKGKYVTEEDFEAALQWVIEDNREQTRTRPEMKTSLVRWILTWKLFSEKAFASEDPQMKTALRRALDWAWRYQCAEEYVSSTIIPAIHADTFRVDTQLIQLEAWDAEGSTEKSMGPAMTSDFVTRNKQHRVTAQVFKAIYDIRQMVGVTYLDKEKEDFFAKGFDKLLTLADSLTSEMSTINDAGRAYYTLTLLFPFEPRIPEVYLKEANASLAIGNPGQAVEGLRKLLSYELSPDVTCKTLYTMSLIQYQRMGQTELPRLQYEWIKTHVPASPYADSLRTYLGL
jgi:hypothetical protein